MSDVVLIKLESIGSETDDRGFHPPHSILYLADSLEKAGFSLKLVHEEGTEANIQFVLDLISTEKPYFVGFSVVTGPQIIPCLTASEEIKKKFNIPIIWGGLQPTILPKESLEKTFIDLLVMGEGESTIVELAEILSQQGYETDKVAEVKGIAFRKNGRIVFTEPRPFIIDLDSHNTAWHYLDIERYIRPEIYQHTALAGERTIAINTSRGCPWRCGYCYNPQINKRIFRAQSAAHVIKEVNVLKKKYNISAIRFSEDHFFSNRKRALEIIRNIDLPWNATIRIDDLAEGGDDFVRELAESQCALLRCGIESGSQRILNLIKKDITLDQVRKAAELCAKYKIKVGFFFMLGFPGESWEEACQTMDLMDELEKIDDCLLAALPVVFCAFPATALLDTAKELGYISPDSLEGWGAPIDVVIKYSGSLPPYVDKRVDRAINYLRLLRRNDFGSSFLSLPAKFFRKIAKYRWKHRYFNFPLDWHVANLGKKLLEDINRF